MPSEVVRYHPFRSIHRRINTHDPEPLFRSRSRLIRSASRDKDRRDVSVFEAGSIPPDFLHQRADDTVGLVHRLPIVPSGLRSRLATFNTIEVTRPVIRILRLGKLEELNLLPNGNPAGQPVAEPGEIRRCQMICTCRFAHSSDQQFTGFTVVRDGARRAVARAATLGAPCEKCVADVGEIGCRRQPPRISSRLQVITNFEIFLQGGIAIVMLAKVVEVPPGSPCTTGRSAEQSTENLGMASSV